MSSNVFSEELFASAQSLLSLYRQAGLRIATAESCTGGLVAALLTEVAGSSDVVECGFVTYSNEAKMEMLGVTEGTLMAHGAVSRETAEEMALGAQSRSRADVAVSITGIAGPGGATPTKPVGLVHLASAREGQVLKAVHEIFPGDRSAVRLAALRQALSLLHDAVH